MKKFIILFVTILLPLLFNVGCSKLSSRSANTFAKLEETAVKDYRTAATPDQAISILNKHRDTILEYQKAAVAGLNFDYSLSVTDVRLYYLYKIKGDAAKAEAALTEALPGIHYVDLRLPQNAAVTIDQARQSAETYVTNTDKGAAWFPK